MNLGFRAPPQEFAWYFTFICVIGPIWEEIVFRYGVFEFFPKVKQLPKILVSSIIFGLMHNSDMVAHGLLIQGVLGMVFAVMYIRHGLKGSIILHGCWNLLCLIL